MTRLRLLLPAALMLAALAPAAGALPRAMDDSTSYDRWRLQNGLEVVTRHIPGAAGVAVTLGVRAGSAYDPPRWTGLAEVLADLSYYGPSAAAPARTPEDMVALRPRGWGLQTNHRLALLTEIVSADQVPGVLQQLATRLAPGVPDPAALAAATRRVSATAMRRYFTDPNLAAYYRVGELARGTSDEKIVMLASGKALAGLQPREAGEHLVRLYCPANAVLSLAGDLSGWDPHALVEAALGPLPPGKAQPEPRAPSIAAGERITALDGLSAPRGAVGVPAPSLDDSLHASFFLATAVIGASFNQAYSAMAPDRSHFSYSLYDDPELLRIFPEVSPQTREVEFLETEVSRRAGQFGEEVVNADLLDQIRRNMHWLLGGPLRRSLRERFASDPSGLGTLATTQATRVLWRGDEFWARYRQAFETLKHDHSYWLARLVRPGSTVRLLLVPPR
jgi:predicted Zn-dependent peptidase